MEVGVRSSDTGGKLTGIAMDYPVNDDWTVMGTCSPPIVPARLRRRLSESKAGAPTSVEEIEAKLRDAGVRRQKFYENLSSKARTKPRSPSHSGEDLGQRLYAKLQAAEQKRLSILEKAKLRLAKLDELRQAAKTGLEMRSKRECAELRTKVESRCQQAEANRMFIRKNCCQRRSTHKERISQSIVRRMSRDSKYKQRVHADIYKKHAAAEMKRLVLLEVQRNKACARILQVREVANSVSQQHEIERAPRDKLEDRLRRGMRQKAEDLVQKAPLHSTIPVALGRRYKLADHLSRKLARCWRKFKKMRRTTLDLTNTYNALKINKSSIKTMPFEQFALLIQSASTLQAAKALLDRLENRYIVSCGFDNTGSGRLDNISHLLKRVASPNKMVTQRKSGSTRDVKQPRSVREAAKIPVQLSRYQVRVILCAYMILGHPDAVFSGRGKRESDLVKSAEKFVEEFELLIKIILDGPAHTPDPEYSPASTRCRTFKSQLTAFDGAWCSYLNSFVEWKVKDAESLEEDLVRAACQLELSMIQKCKLTPEGHNSSLSHDLKAIQEQVAGDQKLLREKVLQLSGCAGIEHMEAALTKQREKYFQGMQNGSPVGSPITQTLSPSMPSPSFAAQPCVAGSVGRNHVVERTESPSHVVRSLFKDDNSLSPEDFTSSSRRERLDQENELIVHEAVHVPHHIFSDSYITTEESQNGIEARLREAMEKAFWDGVMESMKQDEPKYDRVVELMREVRDELCDMAPQSWNQEICQAIDLDILSQVLNKGEVDMGYLGRLLEFALITLQKLSAAAQEDELKESGQNLMKELTELCHSGDGSNYSRVIVFVNGLQFVLQQIQVLKQEISKARIRIMEPLLKGAAAFDYLGNAFIKRYGPPSDASTALPLTVEWLSSMTSNSDQESDDHTNALSELRSKQGGSSQGFLPPTSLRTGGSFSVRANGSQVTSLPYAPGNRDTECKGEKIDLLIRLGLLKLVSGVSGLKEETLPETLKLNLLRLRTVQAELQKTTVIATCILVLRQTLLTEKILTNSKDMENVVFDCVNQVSVLVDTVEDVGMTEIIEVLSKFVENRDKSSDMVKVQSRRNIMSRMLSKSLQDGDAVFVRVSRAIYLAARGMVLGGVERHGRILTETALRQIGAAVLTDRMVEVAKVLVVTANVSGGVHGPWYARIMKNM